MTTLSELWADDQRQAMAEYAVMLAAILVMVIGRTANRFSTNNAFRQSPGRSTRVDCACRRRETGLKRRALLSTEPVKCPFVSRMQGSNRVTIETAVARQRMSHPGSSGAAAISNGYPFSEQY